MNSSLKHPVVAEHFPMKRELKVLFIALRIVASPIVAEHFPMKRELKEVEAAGLDEEAGRSRALPYEEGTEREHGRRPSRRRHP